MPILKGEDGKLAFYFGKGDIVFSSAYDKGGNPENDYIAFWQSDKPYPIDEPLPELTGKEVHNWNVKMFFPKRESLQSLINFLTEYRDEKWPPKSQEEVDNSTSSNT